MDLLTEVNVFRIGHIEKGYLTRVLVVLFSALAVIWPKVHKKALISFIGCGLVWSAVELIIVLVGNRAGPMTLTVSCSMQIILSCITLNMN